MKVEFSELLLNENAYFYKVKRRLLPRDIQIIFEESLKDKKGTRKFESKIRESFVHGASEIAKISLDIFEYKKRPSFLKKEVKSVFETKFGLFLIVEVGDFIALIRKNVSGIDTFDSSVEKIDYNILTRFLLKENSKYEKLVTSNMNAASKAIQRKTSEAEDLQGVFSRFGASKQILNSLRVDNEGHKSTVTINTSRVNSFNLQRDFDAIIVWIVDMVKLIRLALKNPPQSNFIDSFATPINFKDKIKDLEPAYLLLRFGVLKDEIENGHVQRIVHKATSKKVDLERDIFSNERLFKLEEIDENVYSNGEVKVKIRKESINVSIDNFKEMMIDFGSEYEISLNNYINNESHFIVIFDQFEYVYSHWIIRSPLCQVFQ